MTESSPKGLEIQWEKEKLLITSNFSFSHSVFKRLVLQTLKNKGLFEKGLLLFFNIIPVITQWPVQLHVSMLTWRSLLPVLHTIFFSNFWLFSHITIVGTLDSGEKEIIPVASSSDRNLPSFG